MRPAPLVLTLLFGFGFADVDLRPVDIGVFGLNFRQNSWARARSCWAT